VTPLDALGARDGETICEMNLYTPAGQWHDDAALIASAPGRVARAEAAEAKVARYEAVLRWFVGEFPCPEIHASINNKPGRCPEDSDDPNEWCASARFQRALAGPGGTP